MTIDSRYNKLRDLLRQTWAEFADEPQWFDDDLSLAQLATSLDIAVCNGRGMLFEQARDEAARLAWGDDAEAVLCELRAERAAIDAQPAKEPS